jgi:hypothetical protein
VSDIYHVSAIALNAHKGSDATGPEVSTAAPWPWIDVDRPYILPRFIEAGKPKADIPSAVSQLKVCDRDSNDNKCIVMFHALASLVCRVVCSFWFERIKSA